MSDLSFTTQSELLHHGIIGQKWGQRNGPPYPLGNRISTGKRLKTTQSKIPEENKKIYDKLKPSLGNGVDDPELFELTLLELEDQGVNIGNHRLSASEYNRYVAGKGSSNDTLKKMKKEMKDKRNEEVERRKEELYTQYLNNEIGYHEMKTKIREIYITPETKKQIDKYVQLALQTTVQTATQSTIQQGVNKIMKTNNKNNNKNKK